MRKNKKSLETIYLRLSYAKNVGKVNIPKELFDIHSYTVDLKSYKAYTSNGSMNSSMGFSREDFKSIAMWHLASYLSSISLLMDTPERIKFIQTYQKKNGSHTFPSDTDFIKKDQSNFMSFLSQRMSDLNRIIVQSAKNVYGSKTIKRLYRVEPNAVNSISDECFRTMTEKELKKFGYVLLSGKEAVKVIKQSGQKYRFMDVFEVDGVTYRKIYKKPETHVYLEDYPFWESIPFSSLADQEDVIIQNRIEYRKERLLNLYRKISTSGKIRMLSRLKRFLFKKGMDKEVKIVNDMISNLV
jgi:hypothetical protein